MIIIVMIIIIMMIMIMIIINWGHLNSIVLCQLIFVRNSNPIIDYNSIKEIEMLTW